MPLVPVSSRPTLWYSDGRACVAWQFHWPAQEAALADLPRFRVTLGGLGIHFVHARAPAPVRVAPADGPTAMVCGMSEPAHQMPYRRLAPSPPPHWA